LLGSDQIRPKEGKGGKIFSKEYHFYSKAGGIAEGVTLIRATKNNWILGKKKRDKPEKPRPRLIMLPIGACTNAPA